MKQKYKNALAKILLSGKKTSSSLKYLFRKLSEEIMTEGYSNLKETNSYMGKALKHRIQET